MSGFENFWNFKTMLDREGRNPDEVEYKPDYEPRINVPFLSCKQLPTTEFFQPDQEDVFPATAASNSEDENFDEALENLEQLNVAELQELRRRIALHSHPDLNFGAGTSQNCDLMSNANSLIDDEIKRRA